MIVVLAILCLLSFSVFAAEPRSPVNKLKQQSYVRPGLQQEKIGLKAQLLSVKVKGHPDKLYAMVNLRVRFTVQNDLERPLLIVPEAVKVVGTRLAKSSDDVRLGPYLLDRLHLPSYKQPMLLSIIDHSSPRVKAVLPGTQWEWEEDLPITLSRGFSNSYPPEVGLEDLQKLDAFWCHFEIAFWPHTMKEEGEHLQQQWRQHGSLLSEAIISSPIRLSLKK